MAVITVGDIILRIKQRADLEKSGASGFVSDTEATTLIQLAAAQLQNLIMMSYESWLGRYVTFSTVANQSAYPFAAYGMPDFYKLLSIGITTAANPDDWTPLDHADNKSASISGYGGGFLSFTNGGGGANLTFCLRSTGIELSTVRSVQLIGVRYIPKPPQFSAITDELPQWIYPGWEEYLVAFVAWMVGIKERAGVQSAKEVWQIVSGQIQNWAPNRDSFRPHTVVQTLRGWNKYGGGDVGY